MRRFLPVILALGVGAAVFVCGWSSSPGYRWRTPFSRNLELEVIRESWQVFRQTPWFSVTLKLSLGAGLLTGILWLVSRPRPGTQGLRAGRSEPVGRRRNGVVEDLAWIVVVVVLGGLILFLQQQVAALGLLGHH